MFQTLNSVPEPVRAQLVALLNQHLASAMDLYLRSKNAHWNVKGATFYALHQLFDQAATYAAESADDLAERAAALGGRAEGTAEAAHLRSSLPPPAEAPPVAGSANVTDLATDLAAFVNVSRAHIEVAIDLGDQATADLLIKITRDGDKILWFLEAHLQ